MTMQPSVSKSRLSTRPSTGADVTSNNQHQRERYTHDRLLAIEATRLAALRRTQWRGLTHIFHLGGTGLTGVLVDPLFISTAIVYTISRVIVYQSAGDVTAEAGEDVQYSEKGNIYIVLGTFLMFFLSYLLSMNYRRFEAQYDLSCCIQGRITDVAVLCGSSNMDPNRARRLLRYMNAGHAAGYVGVSTCYTAKNLFDPVDEEWKLLTSVEKNRMLQIGMESGSACFSELVLWCLTEIYSSHKLKEIDDRLLEELRKLILRFRGSMGLIFDFQRQPMPYFFLYFASIVSIMYLPLHAFSIGYGTGKGDVFIEIVTGLVILVSAFLIVGLRVLAQKLSNPYGNDVQDLAILSFVHGSCRGSFRILASESPVWFDEDVEEELNQMRSDRLGRAWVVGPFDDYGDQHETKREQYTESFLGRILDSLSDNS